MPPRPTSPAIAFLVGTLGIASFSGMDALMKLLAMGLGTYNALLWRTLAGALLGGLVFLAARSPWPQQAVLRLHLVRGILSAAMAVLFFWGLARVPLAQGVTLGFVSPLIALYLAAIILGERISRRAIAASLLGFAGVLVIMAGQARADLGAEAIMGSIAILLSAGLYAYNIILMRQQAQVARPLEIAFFMSAIMTSCFLLASPWLAVPPAPEHWPAILGAAVLAFVSLLFLSWAYARAEAQVLAPVEYTAFLWATTLGWLVFGEPVQPLTILGAAMIVAGCILAARRGGSVPAVEVVP